MTSIRHIRDVLRHELAGIRPRLNLMQLVIAMIPTMAGIRLRRVLYRTAGVSVGHGTIVMGRIHLTGEGDIARNLIIGRNCVLNEAVSFNLGEKVVIEDNASIGMQCLFLTVSHQSDNADYRGGALQKKPIRIGRGSWLGARVTVLPGVVVGRGAVLGAGSVVTKQIPPDVFAAGIPARIIKHLG